MLEERGSVSSDISLAELTLVTAAPTSHVAASTRAVRPPRRSHPRRVAPRRAPNKGRADRHRKLANEVYRAILVMMDAARARNGEPYLMSFEPAKAKLTIGSLDDTGLTVSAQYNPKSSRST